MRGLYRHAVAAVFGAGVVLSGSAAYAGDPSVCVSGNVCLWSEDNYQANDGSSKRYEYWGDDHQYTDDYFNGLIVNDNTSSLTNRGTSCSVVVFQHTYWGGSAIRFNNPVLGGIYQDPNLTNGGGYTAVNAGLTSSSDWDNRLSSHDFCASI